MLFMSCSFLDDGAELGANERCVLHLDHADVLANGSAGFTANNGTLPRKKAPVQVTASRTLGPMKFSWCDMWMQITPPQKPLVSSVPRGEVQGMTNRTAAIISPQPISCNRSPNPYFVMPSTTSGGAKPKTFPEPAKIINAAIRTFSTTPANFSHLF